MRSLFRSASIPILAVVLCGSCASPAAQEAPVARPTASPAARPPEGDRRVEFGGASFQYDPSVFGDVKSEIVPASALEEPDHKPDYVWPEYLHFTFNPDNPDTETSLSVYPVNEFPKVYSVAPHMVKWVKGEIEGLKKIQANISYRVDGSIPDPIYADVSKTFDLRVRHFNFVNGKGILFITHWTHGYDFVSNRNLTYRFEGLTNDGKYYVTAETPVRVAFLPDDTADEVEGLTWKQLVNADGNKENEKRYKAYIKGITDRIEKQGFSDFEPSLETFESIIASLRVDK